LLKRIAIVFTSVVLSLFSMIVSAWALPWYPGVGTPSMYGDRVYTREHWTRFWYNEYGYNLGPSDPHTQFIGGMFCSVFDIPGNLSSGYTAVMSQDVTNSAAVGQSGATPDITLKLQGFGTPQDTDWSYIVSPAYWNANTPSGGTSPFWGQGECEKNVKITKNSTAPDGSTPGFDSTYTKNSPMCISNGSPGELTFVAGGYDGSTPKYWWSGDGFTYGNINLTQNAAAQMYNTVNTTSADICFSYPYGLSVMSLSASSPATAPGSPETWLAYVMNTTPYQATNVRLRAYVVIDGQSTPQLVNASTANILPIAVGNNGTITQNVTAYSFTFNKPNKDYKVLVTANLDCARNLGSQSVAEPLVTTYYYGAFKGNYVHGSNGEMETVKYLPNSNTLNGSYPAYDDNFLLSPEVPVSSGGDGTPYPDYAVTDVQADAAEFEAGQRYNLTCEVGQIDPSYKQDKNVLLEAHLNSSVIYSNMVNLGYSTGIKSVTIPFVYPSGTDQANIIVKINGGNVAGDSKHAISERGRYENNQKTIVGNAPPPGSSPDLAALSIELYDTKGNRMGDTLFKNASYTLKAIFRSYYNQGGFARVRLYQKTSAGYNIRQEKYVFFQPGATINMEWPFAVGSADNITPVITVNYWYNDSWHEENFTLDGSGEKKKESDYTNNLYEKTYAITSGGPPREEGHYASYYPLKEIRTPRYKTIEVQEWVDEWREVPYKKDETEGHIRVYLTSFLVGQPAYAAERAMVSVPINGRDVYGYWLNFSGDSVFVECDPDTNQEIRGWVNTGHFVTRQEQVLDGYDISYVEDYSQPKHYLYPPEAFPSEAFYRDRTLEVMQGSQDPELVGYPFGKSISEDWRPVIIPIYNGNNWSVKTRIHTLMEGDDWTGDVVVGPRETKWVGLKIPAGATANNSRSSYSTDKITYVSTVVENYDPLAPSDYRINPTADDGNRTFYSCDFQGMDFSGSEFKEHDKEFVLTLIPAFKEVMRWVPDDPGNWRIGHPEYDAVPGYKWKMVEVREPNPIEGDPTGVEATQADKDAMAAVGPLTGNKYETTYGTTLKKTGEAEGCSWYDYEQAQWYYLPAIIYQSRIVLQNSTQFVMEVNNFQIAAQYIDDDASTYPFPISGTLQPNETKSFFVDHTDMPYYNGRSYEYMLRPKVYGSYSKGIAGLKMVYPRSGTVKYNAVAGEEWSVGKGWSNNADPSIPYTLFDYDRVMTPAELAQLGALRKGQILTNINYFLSGQPENMRVSAYYNRRW